MGADVISSILGRHHQHSVLSMRTALDAHAARSNPRR